MIISIDNNNVIHVDRHATDRETVLMIGFAWMLTSSSWKSMTVDHGECLVPVAIGGSSY